MNEVAMDTVAGFGEPLVRQIVASLSAQPLPGGGLLDPVHDLHGRSTGFVRVYTAPGIRKITHLSLNLMPGACYFNIVVNPEQSRDAPRFAHEGMVTVHGSQVSVDLYHDHDLVPGIAGFAARMRPLTAVYDEARQSGIAFVPSRQVHMRVLCSPHFLNVFGATAAQLPQLADFARRYFECWLDLFAAAGTLDDVTAAARAERQRHMADTVIALDPDRDKVVQVYGEDTVRAIEQAVMY